MKKKMEMLTYEESELILKAHKRVAESLSMRRHGNSVRNFTAGRKPFKQVLNSANIDQKTGLSVYDMKVLSSIKDKIDVNLLAETGKVENIDRVDGKRWVRFELYSMYQRIRVRFKSNKERWPHLEEIVELLSKLIGKKK